MKIRRVIQKLIPPKELRKLSLRYLHSYRLLITKHQDLNNTTQKGQLSERMAEKHLKRNGLITMVTNYVSPFGEIDLIMKENKTLVFIEVRSLSSLKHGHPLETINLKKQQRIIKTAQCFLQENSQYKNQYCRFDAISLDKNQNIIWIKHAFC